MRCDMWHARRGSVEALVHGKLSGPALAMVMVLPAMAAVAEPPPPLRQLSCKH